MNGNGNGNGNGGSSVTKWITGIAASILTGSVLTGGSVLVHTTVINSQRIAVLETNESYTREELRSINVKLDRLLLQRQQLRIEQER